MELGKQFSKQKHWGEIAQNMLRGVSKVKHYAGLLWGLHFIKHFEKPLKGFRKESDMSPFTC